MKAHYYLGWFTTFFPEKLSKALRKDITDRKSVVMISSNPSVFEEDGATERSWLDQAGIIFQEYHLINYRVQKEDAQRLIQQASVIFLLGGSTINLNRFLMEYDLSECIRNCRAVVLGASAGAINMSAKWLCSKNLGYDIPKSSVYDGIGLSDFSILSHFDLEDNMELVRDELSPLSGEMNVFASNKDCAVRVKGDQIDIFGHVYLISRTTILKVEETSKFC
ncbi:hypothetical protein NCCP2222_00580 [Sporosarcina sp. NCCP-2222]|uniref:Type 1 glutamine amidotransferase-like domain-containing protein n=1 Tax=Sporosarcina sp. NCCP-2222 TaxID=2935073 RepID=UPI00207F4CBA|nr:Type 1 glutamine amidotransferase-like domain-containing protein [Sporosarcina sp. NCCP-2222]GKV54111.1 hypothetical protein NCCP2222_00580 [Sporosarcina sp. NCCP-2222]